MTPVPVYETEEVPPRDDRSVVVPELEEELQPQLFRYLLTQLCPPPVPFVHRVILLLQGYRLPLPEYHGQKVRQLVYVSVGLVPFPVVVVVVVV